MSIPSHCMLFNDIIDNRHYKKHENQLLVREFNSKTFVGNSQNTNENRKNKIFSFYKAFKLSDETNKQSVKLNASSPTFIDYNKKLKNFLSTYPKFSSKKSSFDLATSNENPHITSSSQSDVEQKYQQSSLTNLHSFRPTFPFDAGLYNLNTFANVAFKRSMLWRRNAKSDLTGLMYKGTSNNGDFVDHNDDETSVDMNNGDVEIVN